MRLPSSKPAVDTNQAHPPPAFKLSGSFKQAGAKAPIPQVCCQDSFCASQTALQGEERVLQLLSMAMCELQASTDLTISHVNACRLVQASIAKQGKMLMMTCLYLLLPGQSASHHCRQQCLHLHKQAPEHNKTMTILLGLKHQMKTLSGTQA